MNDGEPLLEGDLRNLARKASMRDSSRASLKEALADLVPEKGLTRQRITRALAAEGWRREEARQFSAEVLDAVSDRAIRSSERLETLFKSGGSHRFRQIGGLSDEEVWLQFASQMGAHFARGGILTGHVFGRDKILYKVLARVRNWTIALDTRVVTRRGEYGTTSTHYYTRVRAPFTNLDGLRFTVYRKTVFSGLRGVLAMQDVEVGHPAFDREFIVKANHEAKIKSLLASGRIRHLLESEPAIVLRAQHPWRLFSGRLPKGVDELYLEVPGRITEGVEEDYFAGTNPNPPPEVGSGAANANPDTTVNRPAVERLKSLAVYRLKSLHELTAETLNQLVRIRSASEEDPRVVL